MTEAVDDTLCPLSVPIFVCDDVQRKQYRAYERERERERDRGNPAKHAISLRTRIKNPRIGRACRSTHFGLSWWNSSRYRIFPTIGWMGAWLGGLARSPRTVAGLTNRLRSGANNGNRHRRNERTNERSNDLVNRKNKIGFYRYRYCLVFLVEGAAQDRAGWGVDRLRRLPDPVHPSGYLPGFRVLFRVGWRTRFFCVVFIIPRPGTPIRLPPRCRTAGRGSGSAGISSCPCSTGASCTRGGGASR